jgi:hypothetical protein
MSKSRLPNFLIIGAMKASTTTFYQALLRHPQVWMPDEKEPHYFTSSDYGTEVAWCKYLKLFQEAPITAKAVGEASTGYSKLPRLGATPERIQKDLGEPKLIYLVRDPVARAISNYRHSYDAGAYPSGTSFGDALHQDPIILAASRYHQQIQGYLKVFERNQLLILVAEQFHANPRAMLCRTERHLGLDAYHDWPERLESVNSATERAVSQHLNRHIPPSMKKIMRRFCPNFVRQAVYSQLARRQNQDAPEVSQSDRRFAYEAIRDDLDRFVSFEEENLRTELECWPSVQALINQR